MKKRKYYNVIIILVISFFSLLLVSCKDVNESQKDNTPKTEEKDNKEIEDKDKDQEDNQEDNQEENPGDNSEEQGESQYYFLDDYDNRVDLRSEEQIDGYLNYEKNIYFVSSRIKEMNVGEAITICNKNGVVGLNVFDTMANCLIYVNALDDESSPIIYLDSGKINEVFHFYHDNLTIYGPYAGVTDEKSRDNKLEAIFTGSVSVRGDNIVIDGVAVDDLENTITIYGKNCVLRNIVKNSYED